MSGNTQRRSARLLTCSTTTVERKFQWLFKYKHLLVKQTSFSQNIFIDEMESIEHTKLKPLTIPLCVDADYKILASNVGQIPAKGHLSKLSVIKYGPRLNQREQVLEELLAYLKTELKLSPLCITTDSHPSYPGIVKKYFPQAKHLQVIARHQKEKKRELLFENKNKKIFDPMFALNQRCAKLRQDIRRLSRRSWCTTKKVENLKKHLQLYQIYNNNNVAIN